MKEGNKKKKSSMDKARNEKEKLFSFDDGPLKQKAWEEMISGSAQVCLEREREKNCIEVIRKKGRKGIGNVIFEKKEDTWQ